MLIAGSIVTPEGVLENGRIEISDRTGLIERVGRWSKLADYTFPNELIFPGFIDIHTHLRQDPSKKNNHKETFRTGSLAAVNGGVVAVCNQANSPKPPIDEESLSALEGLIERHGIDVPIIQLAGIGQNTSPLERKLLYKLFMGAIKSNKPAPYIPALDFYNNQQIDDALPRYRGQEIAFHCEDTDLLMAVMEAKTHEERRPPRAEVIAIDFALQMIEKYHLKGRICHVSTRAGLEKIIEAKSRGVKVTAEVTPHHLYYDTSMLNEENRKWLQMNPPLRSRDDRLYLIEALRKGHIDYIASDHAPHTREEKEKGISGVPHLDTYGLFVTWLMRDHSISPQQIAKVCSQNPAQVINQYLPEGYGKGLGKIEEGYAASFTIINPSKPTRVTRSGLRTKCGWSPFEGETFAGRPTYTVIKGEFHETEWNRFG